MTENPGYDPLLERDVADSRRKWGMVFPTINCCLFLALLAAIAWLGNLNKFVDKTLSRDWYDIRSERGSVASDDYRCSKIGVSMLRKGGHAVDASIATALCLGIVCQTSSGIGGGNFMVVHSSGSARAYNFRETAPAAATEDMYEKNPTGKYSGPLSMGIPGEIAGLHVAWSKYGRLPWKTLFDPSIELARNGFTVSVFLGSALAENKDMIMSDPGLRNVYALNGRLLISGETCYNVELGNTLEDIAENGPQSIYGGGNVGRKLVEDVRKGGGILTLDDLRNYNVSITDAVTVNSMGYTILGMPPPSSGMVSLALVLNILQSYGTQHAVEGPLGLHRLIELLKHMMAIRTGLGDPAFVNITETVSNMLSPEYAAKIRKQIFDNTTFPPDYYSPKWSRARESGTSHLCAVDPERNAVSMTGTVNHFFGAGVISPSTGILLNNEMDDFSIPKPDTPPPSPANFIRPGKRPLSSMTPIVILKRNELNGVLGGAGGVNIIPGVTQLFLNHFILGMKPLEAMEDARVYHWLIPNKVKYENSTVFDGNHVELSEDRRKFLKERHHVLESYPDGATCNLVVQNYLGVLVGVGDFRRGGRPAGF